MFAILLVVVAPLISVSLQKDPMSTMPGMHHEMSMTHELNMHHQQPAAVTMPVDHGEACGYCVLFAQVPGLILAIVLLLCAILLRQKNTRSRPIVKHWHFFPWLFPNTRAPPCRSAIS
nr:DUF2946 domain-containing protein [Citrobacter sp. NCU1]